MGIRSLNRWQAFSGHFGCSLLLAVAVFSLFRFVWYPEGLFELAGAGTLLLLVVGVDVVMGPLLTLIVFTPQKKSLYFDLAVIVMLQLGALGYGVWVMAQSRPVFLVAVNDVFILVSANDIHVDDLARAEAPEFRSLPWGKPKLVGALPPKDPQERENLVFESLKGGPDLHQLPRYYVPYAQVRSEFIKQGKALQSMPEAKSDLRERIRAELKSRGIDEADAVYVVLRARKGFGTMVMSRTTGLPIYSLPDDPEPTAVKPASAPSATADAASQPT